MPPDARHRLTPNPRDTLTPLVIVTTSTRLAGPISLVAMMRPILGGRKLGEPASPCLVSEGPPHTVLFSVPPPFEDIHSTDTYDTNLVTKNLVACLFLLFI
jgi:hypothetical protein